MEQPVIENPMESPESASEPLAENQPKVSGWAQLIMDVLETLLLSVVMFVVINALSARVRVDGFSMLPTLQDGEYVLVNRLAYKLGNPERGDIIVFHFPLDETQDLIKRVIGLPGDVIRVENGVLSVNGQTLTEPYIAAAPLYDGEWQVPPNYLFVLGDNRNDSSDSHSWGPVSFDKIIGKAIMVYWPFNQWSMIDHFEFAKASQ
ncbi:MAG TPA: signal peptidase I [Pseudomonadales bacterium]|nr:signal peptidase I [Pseudomonadales bacterium]